MFESIPYWSFTIVLGPIILAAAIAFALLRRRRLSPGERNARSRAVERNYTDPKNDG